MAELVALALSVFVVGDVFADETYTAKFISNWKEPVFVETTGRLVLEHPGNYNGKMFVGWRDSRKKLHPKWAEVTITADAEYRAEYAPLDLSIWTAGSDGKVVGKRKTGRGIVYAIGDSMTFGTKAGGPGKAWAKQVADGLGLEYVNDAKAGSRLSAWRSVLTRSANHNQAFDSDVGGVTRERMLAGIRRAGVIAFTIGTNDLLYKNKGEDVAYRLFEFVEALHRENPQALVVVVGGDNVEAFREGGKYAEHGREAAVLNDALAKALNGPKFRDYAVYVDVTDLFGDPRMYEPCERAPDGVHPGFEGHRRIARKVLAVVEARPGAKAAPVFDLPPATAVAAIPPMVAMPSREAMWSLADAGRVRTLTREKISLNGLWAFKPEDRPQSLDAAPKTAAMNLFFKVPGKWPSKGGHVRNGMAVYDERGADVFGREVGEFDGAWYARTVAIPDAWRGREVKLGFAWIPSAVLVYVDGRKAGEVFFPGGEIRLTDALAPGAHEIAFYTSAKLPETLVTAFDAPDTARTFTKKAVNCRGVHGDVWLAAEPKGVRISDVQCRPSVKDGRLDFSVGFECADAAADAVRGLRAVAEVYDGERRVKTFASEAFAVEEGKRFVFGGAWTDPKLWDLDAPQNLYTLKMRLERNGRTIDEGYPEEFGFREIRIEGRNLLLNGSVVHFRPRNTRYPVEGAVSGEDVRQAALKMKAAGFNSLVSEANYGFSEGDLSMIELTLKETSRVGMAMTIGLPHPNRFDNPDNPHHWQYGPAYDRLVQYIVKRFQNVPGLLYWSSTHNQTGYESDQNPEIISGKPEEIPTGIIDWRQRFRKLALVVNEKMGEFDPTRPVYHHESGALGTFYTLNCYLNWAPIQERSDWFEHWERHGVVPLFLVEWGTPHIASWSSYRGGPKQVNIWSARDWTQQCWMNEFNASFLGERAFGDSPSKRLLMDRHQYKLKGNRPSYYGGNFTQPLIEEADTHEVLSMYARRNYRDMRARGVTSFLPWDMDGGTFFTNNPALPSGGVPRAGALDGIKAFGVVKSDYYHGLFDQADELPRGVGCVLRETHAPLLGWIAGPTDRFTVVNDACRAGETLEKSLVMLNDTRRSQTIAWRWVVPGVGAKAEGRVEIAPGGRADVPIAVKIPATHAPGRAQIHADFRVVEGTEAGQWSAQDAFALRVLPAARKARLASSVRVVDPEGTAKALLTAVGVPFEEAKAAPGDGLLVIGRRALDRVPFDLAAVARAGVKIVVLEQDAATLSALGFRTQEYGLRNLFSLDGAFDSLDLTDWRGNATLLPETLDEDKMSGQFPVRQWEGFENRRVWRAGNRGLVAGVLPEKPAVGDFRARVHGGFDLQYAPVLEYTEPGVRVMLCQLEVSGRTERSPEAEEAFAAVLEQADRPLPAAAAATTWVLEGGDAVAKTLHTLKIPFAAAASAEDAKPGDVLVFGPGVKVGGSLTPLVERGVNVLVLGVSAVEANTLLPGLGARACSRHEYPAFHASLRAHPALRGVSNADIQWTYPSNLDGLARFGDDVLLARSIGKGTIVFSSIAPWVFDDAEIALRVNRRRASQLVTRLACNLGATPASGFLDRLRDPPADGFRLYADTPRQDDDPYRYYRW
ncbi:MAG: GDSL-type esterase/lipase family protein [Kiritimatiellia bacterium]